MARRSRTFYKEAEVEIDCGDIIEFIESYASDIELEEISEAIAETLPNSTSPLLFLETGLEGGLIREEKLELLSAAYHKFSLQELEQKLGTKFDLL